jgi:hypothetical protein
MPRNPSKRCFQTPRCNAFTMRSLPGGVKSKPGQTKLNEDQPIGPSWGGAPANHCRSHLDHVLDPRNVGAPKLEQAEHKLEVFLQPLSRIHPKTISGTTIQDEGSFQQTAYYQLPETRNQHPAVNDQLPAIPPDIHYLLLESVGKIDSKTIRGNTINGNYSSKPIRSIPSSPYINLRCAQDEDVAHPSSFQRPAAL